VVALFKTNFLVQNVVIFTASQSGIAAATQIYSQYTQGSYGVPWAIQILTATASSWTRLLSLINKFCPTKKIHVTFWHEGRSCWGLQRSSAGLNVFRSEVGGMNVEFPIFWVLTRRTEIC